MRGEVLSSACSYVLVHLVVLAMYSVSCRDLEKDFKMLLSDASQALKGLASRKVTKGLQQKHVKISRDKAIGTGGVRAAGLKTSGWSQMWRSVSICKATFGSHSLLTFCWKEECRQKDLTWNTPHF